MISFTRSLSLASRGVKNYIAKRPFCVSFEVTYRCNALCKHCHLGGPVDEQRASPQKYAAICRQLKPVVAQVSGGEPLLRRDLEQIIEALRIPNRAPFIVVTTNGVLLTKKRYLSLREAGVDEFSLSLDYPDERHDEFRQVPGLFKRIETLMKELESINEKAITLSCVVQSDNFRDLIRLAELAGAWHVNINFSTYTYLRTNKKDYLLSTEELEELKDILHQLLLFKRQHNNVYTSDYTFMRMIDFFENESLDNCRAGVKFMVVNPDGTLSPCGLIIKNYQSLKELKQDFIRSNDCVYCYTSIRANSEKPPSYLIKDGLRSLR
ncbi:MAG: radical SAM protein [Candidatus Aminicenantaceae bacterium]